MRYFYGEYNEHDAAMLIAENQQCQSGYRRGPYLDERPAIPDRNIAENI